MEGDKDQVNVKELSALARKYTGREDVAEDVRELAGGTLLLLQRYQNSLTQLRTYQEPPNSVKFFVEKHLSCDWHGGLDSDTQRRKWKCSCCKRVVDKPSPAVYDPCPEKVKLGKLREE